MKVELQPGTYIVAVSGGVDSVALLHALHQIRGVELVVAHFDHGIRTDSPEDAALVSQQAQSYGFTYITEQGNLGSEASELTARKARYAFLRRVQAKVGAQAIITAHHQDDVLETAILNMVRGTGRRGLTSLKSNETLLRPLLAVPKSDIIAYATKHNLSWQEDTTNYDERYIRNYIRHKLLVRFDANARQQLLAILEQLQVTNKELDTLLTVNTQQVWLDKKWFLDLPHSVAKEVLATWLRNNDVADFDRRTLERLTIALKTKPVGKRLQVLRGYQVVIEPTNLALELAER